MTSLRSALDGLFAELPRELIASRAGGAACRRIADVYDRALAERFTAALEGVTVPLALVATGGWARRELAPYSDIDFIILHDREEAAAKRVADQLLYPLWDEKLAIGHAIREVRAVAKLAKDDLATATALLDARHIAGSRLLSTELQRQTLGAIAPGGNPNELIAALDAEQTARHQRFGASIYLLEPNLKQGIGALRDLATAIWAAVIRWHPPRPGADPLTADLAIADLLERRHLTPRQAHMLGGARDFLLAIRTLVQLASKRRFDQLTFEIQEAIAPTLYPQSDAQPPEGEVRPAVAPSVEALMRDYFMHARAVLQITDHLLEAARVPAKRRPKIEQIDHAFITINGELAARDPQVFANQPSEMIRLFRVAVGRQLGVHGDTRELVASTIARQESRGAGAPLAHDPAAGRLFLDALLDLDDQAQPSAFETMHQLGILSVMMPAWAPCTARVQHDLYHVYTVDQHQLYALAMQKRIARGLLADAHPTATELWRTVRRPGPLLLGTLLHDVGKPLGKGHAEKGAVLCGQIATGLGMPSEDAELAAFLVRQHLTMSHLSQRRDLSDPEVIARFAERVVDDEHLVQLYLLTLCDTAMTAPDNLSAWKDDLLRDLVIRTRAHFACAAERVSNPALRTPDPAERMRAKVLELSDGVAGAREIVDGIDPRLFVQLTPRQTARHVKLVGRLHGSAAPIGLEVQCYPLKGHSELAIVAPDKPGALAAIAGALTANRLDVLGAVLGHVDLIGRRLVVDVFFVRDLKGAAIPEDDARWERLLGDLRAVVGTDQLDPGAVAELIARRRPRSGMPKRVTPGVITEIKLSDESNAATIVEVATQDRMGVLYAITQTLAELGLDISLAKIATEGEKVADTFYVTRAGKRVTDETERAELTARLQQAVGAPGLTG